MNTYKFPIVLESGARRNVTVHTSAKTRAGVLRAAGKTIAHDYHTDVFETRGKVLTRPGTARNYQLNAWSTYATITPADDRAIVDAARGYLFDLAY